MMTDEEYKKYYDLAKDIIAKSFFEKKDKAGEEYIKHIWFVTNNLFDRKFNAILKETNYICTIVALLHDLLEDCPEWNQKSLRSVFPDEIVDIVVVLTKKEDESYHNYINRVSDNEYAIIVKLSDLKHNMDIKRLPELNQNDFERLKKYHKAYLFLKDIKLSIL